MYDSVLSKQEITEFKTKGVEKKRGNKRGNKQSCWECYCYNISFYVKFYENYRNS